MKALTLTQPWAELVANGAKKIETRSWSTAYRGPLAIHAAKSFPKAARALCSESPFREALDPSWTEADALVPCDWFGLLPRGVVVATCRLVRVVFIEQGWQLREIDEHVHWVVPPYEPELSFGDYTPGRYAWILGDIKALSEPVPARGALGLWEWKPNE